MLFKMVITLSMKSKHLNLCTEINVNTTRNTKVTITRDFMNRLLKEPIVEVHPQMVQVRNFPKISYVNYRGKKTLVTEKTFRHSEDGTVSRRQAKKQSLPDYLEREHEGDPITFQEFMTSLKTNRETEPSTKIAVTAIVAAAASGKTTCLKRIANKLVQSCPMFTSAGHPTDKRCSIRMVHYLDIKDIEYGRILTPSQFLFGSLFLNVDKRDEAYHWLINHQSEAILLLDGLDQAGWNTHESKVKDCHRLERGSASDIMYNILSRNLLPRVKIVIALREIAFSQLPLKSHTCEIISLAGLKIADAKILLHSLLGVRGNRIWENICCLSRRTLKLISVPVFLVSIAAIMVENHDDSLVVTATDILTKLLLSTFAATNISGRSRIFSVTTRLKALAHHGIVEQRSVFYKTDLKRFGLSVADADNLTIGSQNNHLLCSHRFEGDFVFFFCHNNFQEFLSASFVAEMNRTKFARFIDRYLDENRWSIVGAFLSGIIHDESSTGFQQVSNRKKKQRLFGKAVRSQIDKQPYVLGQLTDISILDIIYESNNHELIVSLPRLPTIGTSAVLGQDECHMFGSILARRRHATKENEVNLYNCKLTDDLLDLLIEHFKSQERQVRIGDLDLRANAFTAKGLNSLLNNLRADRVILEYERLSEFRYNDLEWKNVRVIDWFPRLRMTAENEFVHFQGTFNGYFDNADEEPRLCLRDGKSRSMEVAISLTNFFNEPYLDISLERQIYATPSTIATLNSMKSKGQIARVLLDCRSAEGIYSTLIDVFVRKFQVTILDILEKDIASFMRSNYITDLTQSQTQIDVNLHGWIKISSSDDVTKIVSVLEINPPRNLRFYVGGRTSLGDISNIIAKFRETKLTLVIDNHFILLPKDYEKVAKLASNYCNEVCIVLGHDTNTAWGLADIRGQLLLS